MAKLAPMTTCIRINQWSQVFKYYTNIMIMPIFSMLCRIYKESAHAIKLSTLWTQLVKNHTYWIIQKSKLHARFYETQMQQKVANLLLNNH